MYYRWKKKKFLNFRRKLFQFYNMSDFSPKLFKTISSIETQRNDIFNSLRMKLLIFFTIYQFQWNSFNNYKIINNTNLKFKLKYTTMRIFWIKYNFFQIFIEMKLSKYYFSSLFFYHHQEKLYFDPSKCENN
jgi:hypothetical protein